MRIDDPALPHHVEEACLNGWPALKEIVFNGWLLRFSDGYTRRANSVNPIAAGSLDVAECVRYCEAAYTRHGLPTMFRSSTAHPVSLDHHLDRLGYAPPEDETRVLYMDMSAFDASDCGDVAIDTSRPSPAWIAGLVRLQGLTDAASSTHLRILEHLCVPAAFARISRHERAAAIAFGAVHNGCVCIASVVTDVRLRRQGLAGRAISALLTWAKREQDAHGACVPVVATNDSALALYETLGFRHEVSRYHYRRRV